MPRMSDYEYQPFGQSAVHWRELPAGLESFGARLKQRRQSAGLTQATLAKRAGITAAFVSQIETGANRPSYRSALILAAVLSVDPHWLISGEGEP